MVWLVPICVQFLPSGDTYPLNVFPLRTIFVQYGYAAALNEALWYVELAPVLGRSYITAVFGSQNTNASQAFEFNVSRIITPACGWVPVGMYATLATIVPSPDSG